MNIEDQELQRALLLSLQGDVVVAPPSAAAQIATIASEHVKLSGDLADVAAQVADGAPAPDGAQAAGLVKRLGIIEVSLMQLLEKLDGIATPQDDSATEVRDARKRAVVAIQETQAARDNLLARISPLASAPSPSPPPAPMDASPAAAASASPLSPAATQAIVDQLVSFGVEYALALVAAKNAHSVDEALTFLSNGAAGDAAPAPASSDAAAAAGGGGRGRHNNDPKMVLVVRTDLNMSIGKVAAQVAHAAVGLHAQINGSDICRVWRRDGEKTVVLKCTDEAEMLALQTAAERAGLPNIVISDAGRTEVASGSRTVFGLVGQASAVDAVTGKLALLR